MKKYLKIKICNIYILTCDLINEHCGNEDAMTEVKNHELLCEDFWLL